MMRGWKIAVVSGTVVAGVTAIAAGGIAYAQGENELIVCKNKYLGSLRAIDSSANCASWEEKITINQQGAPGPAGPTGPTGPTGPAGPQGSAVAKVRFVETPYPQQWGTYEFTEACADGEYATSGAAAITPGYNPNLSVTIDQQGPAGPNGFAQNGEETRGWQVRVSISWAREYGAPAVPPVGLIKAYAFCVKGSA